MGFLEKSLELGADNIVFLLTLNHATGTSARWRLLDKYGYALKEIILLDNPPKETGWPQGGFQLAAAHWAKLPKTQQAGQNYYLKQSDLRGKIQY